jgi:Tfp pilus assembly protein FimT
LIQGRGSNIAALGAGYWQSSTLQAGAQELATAINRGRQLAISRNTTVCVELSGTNITMRTAVCSTGTLYKGPETDGNGVIRLTNGIRVSFAGGSSVVFNNLGAATTAKPRRGESWSP